MSKSKIVEKIQKLLALGQSPNEAEAQSALQKAMELMDMYNIQQEDLKVEDSMESLDYLKAGKVATWVKLLSVAVGKLTSCKALVYSGKGVKAIRVWGKESNLVVFSHTMNYLVEVCDRLTVEKGYGKGRAYCTQYRNGLVMRISQRIDEMLTLDNSTEKALVLRSKALQEIEDFFEKTGKKTKTQVLNVGGRGYKEGVEDGDRVNLNKQMVSKNKRLNPS